jgi:tRNA nucleotidyltransferase (CCA-adding enzyme)
VARAGRIYPQVEPGAAALADRRVVSVSTRATVREALARAEAAGARFVALGPRTAVRTAELTRAAGWGLGRRPARALAWRDLPRLPERAGEIEARRHLRGGAPLLLVGSAGGVVGVVDAERVALPSAESSVLNRLERVVDAPGEARLRLLRAAGRIGEGLGMPAYAVGGFVRDLLIGAVPRAGRPPAGHPNVDVPDVDLPDVDLAVEGDGIAFARRLAAEIGGTLLVHSGFGTASIEAGHAPGSAGLHGAPLGRVDVASARRERYRAAGALPEVTPASLDEDLRRRDFSVNAMAVALAPPRFGLLLDPLGGERDLRAGRLRSLRPLAFVEDPTRIIRAARYAARLSLRPDRATLAGIRLALDCGPYPALSGHRLWREIELTAAEPRARNAFELLVKWEVTSIWNVAVYRRPRLAEVERLARWTRAAGVAVDPAELYLLALLIDRPATVIVRALERLALGGLAAAYVEAAALAGPLARRLGRPRLRPSGIDRLLRPVPAPMVLGAWLHAGARGRRRIQWFLARGRAVRPALSGGELLALGVPRGPRVGATLERLRQLRLDGRLASLAQERELVKEWLTSGKEA